MWVEAGACCRRDLSGARVRRGDVDRLPVSAEDLDDAGFEARLVALGEEQMPTGELCPLELLPSPDCAERLYAILERVGLGERGNVEVYAAA